MEQRHPARGALDYLPPRTAKHKEQWDCQELHTPNESPLSSKHEVRSLGTRNGRQRDGEHGRGTRRARHRSAHWTLHASQTQEALSRQGILSDSLPSLNTKATPEISDDSGRIENRYASSTGRNSSRWSETLESLSFSKIFGGRSSPCECFIQRPPPSNHTPPPDRAESSDGAIKLVITDADNHHRDGGSGSTRISAHGSGPRSGSMRTSLTMSSDFPLPSALGRLGSCGSSAHGGTEPDSFVPDLATSRSRHSLTRGDTSSTPCSTNRSSLLPPRPPDSRASTFDDSGGHTSQPKEKLRRPRARRPSNAPEGSPRVENIVKSAAGAKAKHANCTGPGFASLPPGLARSPTSRFIQLSKGGVSESNSSTLNDSGLLSRGEARRSPVQPTPAAYDRIFQNEGDVPQLTRPAPRTSEISSEEETPQIVAPPVTRPHFARRALSIIGINPDKESRNKRKSKSSELSAAPRTRDLSDHSLLSKFKSQLLDSPSPSTASMGNVQCCGGRAEVAARTLAQSHGLDFLNPQGPLSDHERFDNAYSSNDVQALVSLISSTEPFEYERQVDEPLHPWAQTPASIGALAMTQIAALASGEDPEMKERIKAAGAIPILTRELGSREEDRSDAALVALSFLSIDFPKANMEMFEHGIFEKLIPLIRRPKPGVRAAAAQTARNIFVLDVRYRRAFRNAGGCQPLVDLLAVTPKDRHRAEDLEIQLEAVYHIDDFMMVNGDEVSDCVDAIKATNVGARLEALSDLEGDDISQLRDAARQLYLRVAE